MAFATKYRLEFQNMEGRSCCLNIKVNGYSSSVISILGAGKSPIVIKRYGNDMGFNENPIRGSEMIIKIISESNSQFAELFASPGFPPVVEYKEDSTPLWTGRVYPEQYTEPYVDSPYVTTIKAYDGLGNLKNIIFDAPTNIPRDFLFPLSEIVALILQETKQDTDLRFRVFNNIHSAKGAPLAEDYTDILSDKYIDIRAFRNGKTYYNCYDILAAICRAFGFIIYQNVNPLSSSFTNKWYIVRPKYFKFDTTHQYRDYLASGTEDTHGGVEDKKTITGGTGVVAADRCVFINYDQLIEVTPPCKYQNYVLNSKRKINLLCFHNMEGNFYDDEFMGTVVLHWTPGNNCSYSHISGTDYIEIPASTIAIGLASECLMNYNMPLQTFNERVKINFSVHVHQESSNFESMSAICQVVYTYKIGAVDYALYVNPNGYWLNDPASGKYISKTIQLSSELDRWLDFELDTDKIPTHASHTDRKLVFRLYRCYTTAGIPSGDDYVRFRGVRVGAYITHSMYGEIDLSETYTKTFKQEISEDNFYVDADIETSVGEVWTIHNPIAPYQNTFFLSTVYASLEEPILAWKEWDGYANIVSGWLVTDILRFAVDKTTPALVLRGTIRGNISFSTILVDKHGNRYFPNSIEYDAKRNEWRGEWIQILRLTPEILGDFNEDFNEDFLI